MIEIIGIIATILAVAGVILNNRRCIWCFGLWVVSNALTGAIHGAAGIWSLFARDMIFLALAIEGAYRWREHARNRVEGANAVGLGNDREKNDP